MNCLVYPAMESVIVLVIFDAAGGDLDRTVTERLIYPGQNSETWHGLHPPPADFQQPIAGEGGVEINRGLLHW